MDPGKHAFMRPATRDWRRRTILVRLRGAWSPKSLRLAWEIEWVHACLDECVRECVRESVDGA